MEEMKFAMSLASLILFFLIAGGVAFYLTAFIPYVVEMNLYDVESVRYENRMKDCYQKLGVEYIICEDGAENCSTPLDKGIVAGCQDIEKPQKPESSISKTFAFFKNLFEFPFGIEGTEKD